MPKKLRRDVALGACRKEPRVYPWGSIFTRSLLHNLFVLLVGFAFAFLGRGIDGLLGIKEFPPLYVTGLILLSFGFFIRLWATCLFYERQMRVISLVPQKQLVTTGPFSFSKNPLYLGGNLFIFLGAMLVLGTPSGIFLNIIVLLLTDLMIRREERQLELKFGEEWREYKKKVRRWV